VPFGTSRAGARCAARRGALIRLGVAG